MNSRPLPRNRSWENAYAPSVAAVTPMTIDSAATMIVFSSGCDIPDQAFT